MIRFSLSYTGQFKKDYKKALKSNLDIEKLHYAFKILENSGTLPSMKYKTHPLKGNYKLHFEAHLSPDWLLIWMKHENEIVLVRTGTHSDLFK